jgi:hypothetical protein
MRRDRRLSAVDSGREAVVTIREAPESPFSQWVIWEPPPTPPLACQFRMRGVNYVVFHPCSNIPGSGNYLHVMRTNAKQLRRVLKTSLISRR